MKILDFLFYYIIRVLQVTDRRKVKTITYPDQAAYVVAIWSILLMIFVNFLLEYILFDTFKSKIPSFIFMVVGMGLYFLYRHIYIKKGRYNLILRKSDPKFNVTDKTGRIIALIIFFSSLVIPMLTTIILHSIK